MKLWMDDVREAPDGWQLKSTVVDALVRIINLENWTPVTELSLDHDMGAGNPNGYDLLYCMARLHLTVPKITVHSMNPEGAEQMRAFIERMELQA